MIWTYATPDPTATLQRIAPDGCPELIIDLGAPYEEQAPDGRFHLQPPAIFAGQLTQPMAIRPVGPVEIVAIRFQPDGARGWLGRPLQETTDRRLDVTARTATLKARLAPLAGDAEAQARVAADWIEEARRDGGWLIDPLVRAEVEAALADQPSPARSSARRRALQRRFRDHVGVSPRMLRSVFRFRRVFDRMNDGADGWLEAGLEAGYFDQPQMARDFRRFLGCTATAWAREQVELARHAASQTYKPVAVDPVQDRGLSTDDGDFRC